MVRQAKEKLNKWILTDAGEQCWDAPSIACLPDIFFLPPPIPQLEPGLPRALGYLGICSSPAPMSALFPGLSYMVLSPITGAQHFAF